MTNVPDPDPDDTIEFPLVIESYHTIEEWDALDAMRRGQVSPEELAILAAGMAL